MRSDCSACCVLQKSTALHIAVTNLQFTLAMLALPIKQATHGTDANCIDAENGCAEIVEALLVHGSDVNCIDAQVPNLPFRQSGHPLSMLHVLLLPKQSMAAKAVTMSMLADVLTVHVALDRACRHLDQICRSNQLVSYRW